MSNGRKRNDALRARCPQRHCTEGHCCKPIRQGFEWTICRDFISFIKSGKTPSVNCPYYVY